MLWSHLEPSLSSALRCGLQPWAVLAGAPSDWLGACLPLVCCCKGKWAQQWLQDTVPGVFRLGVAVCLTVGKRGRFARMYSLILPCLTARDQWSPFFPDDLSSDLLWIQNCQHRSRLPLANSLHEFYSWDSSLAADREVLQQLCKFCMQKQLG